MYIYLNILQIVKFENCENAMHEFPKRAQLFKAITNMFWGILFWERASDTNMLRELFLANMFETNKVFKYPSTYPSTFAKLSRLKTGLLRYVQGVKSAG